jgi:predicted GNAT superfamily acetyltransferase
MTEIRPLQTLDELHACEMLQKEIWGFEDISIVPHHLLLTTLKNGGVLLGAFASARLIGFVYGFPGIEDNKLKHCSLMCAVLPERRFQGVGYQLKLKQREAVLAQGIELITWTFDPLVSPNAYFNLHKLGVISQRYERNLYGDMRDRLNAGLETDRLAVEWWIASPRVQKRLEHEQPVTVSDLPVVNQTKEHDGLLVNCDCSLQQTEPKVLVEVPYQWQRMRERDLELTKRWRHETREIFEHFFSQGYYASDFLVMDNRAFYLLERASKEDLLAWGHSAPCPYHNVSWCPQGGVRAK